MRKDVKLGFTIGGVLLAVLIVYVLVISSGPPRKSDVSLAKPELTPVPDGTQQASSSGQPSQPAPESDPNKPQPGDAATLDPFKPVGSEKTSGSGGGGSDEDKWALALQTGKVPLLMTETPAPQDKSGNATATDSTGVAANGAAPNAAPSSATPNGVTPNSGAIGSDAGVVAPGASQQQQPNTTAAPGDVPGETLASQILGSGSATQSASGLPGAGKRTHVVQRGESFTTIAAAAYGNGAYYPHLIRANPNLDPKKLRPGMTIVIPDPADVVARGSDPAGVGGPFADSATPGNSTNQTADALDQQTQYRVKPSDSLYKISMKLYGKADHVDKLYQLNRDVIGANPAHLKVGMILKLPDPPTSSAAAR